MWAPIFKNRSGDGENEPLDGTDYRILTYLLDGVPKPDIPDLFTLPPEQIRHRLENPRLQTLLRQIERGIVERLADLAGIEPVTRAKAAAPDAMARIIRLSQIAKDSKVRLAASKEILRYAGVEPPRKLEITTPDKLLDQMTPQELARLADHKIWPTRFKDALRYYLPSPAAEPRGLPEVIDVTPNGEPDSLDSEPDLPKSTSFSREQAREKEKAGRAAEAVSTRPRR